MLYIGIDWSEAYHQVAVHDETGKPLTQWRMKPTPEELTRIETEREKLGVAARECLVGIETSHNLVVDFLLDFDYRVYVLAPGRMVG